MPQIPRPRSLPRPRTGRRAATVVAVAVLCSLTACSQPSDDDSTTSPSSTSPSTATSDSPTSAAPSPEPTTDAPTSADPGPTDEAPVDEPSDAPSPAPSPSDDTADLAAVSPVVTFAGPGQGGTEVYASVNGIVEADGRCTATLTAPGTEAVTQQVDATADASSTLCEPLVFPAGALAAGTWTVVVSYRSSASAGDSAAVDLEVVG